MRIERMAVYTANLEYTGKAYAFAGGRSHQAFETTVVALSTDTGLEGYGEVCPCGPNYMAAFAEGFRHIQIKLGHEVEEDIDLVRRLGILKHPDELWIGDINGAWRRDQALRFSKAIEDVDIYLEQPCRSYEECLSVRRRAKHLVKLDEAFNTLNELQRGLRDDAMDAIALKVSKFGGLTPSRIIRDVCADAGIPMTIEDALGSSRHALPIESHNNKQAPPKRSTATWTARFFPVVGAGFLAKRK